MASKRPVPVMGSPYSGGTALKPWPAICFFSIRNQNQFDHARTLLLGRERAEESFGRADYAISEPNAAAPRYSPKRTCHINRYRPVHQWEKTEIS